MPLGKNSPHWYETIRNQIVNEKGGEPAVTLGGIKKAWIKKQKERFESLKRPISEGDVMTFDEAFEIALNWGPMGMGQIKSWHGSPHKFDKFSMAKVGTGEGAQAFGHGLYFTSEKKIAEHYKSTGFAGKYKKAFIVDSGEGAGRYTVKGQDASGKIETIAFYNDKASADLAVKQATEKGGELYSVTLHKGKQPGEYDYLSWYDLPKKNQLDAVIKQLGREGRPDIAQKVNDFRSLSEGEFLNNNLYDLLSDNLGSAKEASALLLRAGIDGIEYPAGSLAGKAGKGKNYVVFDESAVTIDKIGDKLPWEKPTLSEMTRSVFEKKNGISPQDFIR